MHFPGPGPVGHGIGLLFGAVIWAIGSLIMLTIIAALIVLLVRYLWFGTKASQRYLELNGQPVRPTRAAAPTAPAATASAATAPTAPTPTTTAPAATAPATARKPAPRPRTTAPKKPPTA